MRAGIASSPASNRWSVPAGAPDETVSTRTAASAPSHASISRLGSSSQETTSTPGGTAVAEPLGDGNPRPVVAAQRVADPDHDGPRHFRSTWRSRKWVAHEMHGS